MPAVLPDIPAVEIAIVEMTNAYRGENKLGDVRSNAALAAAARTYAKFLASSGQFSHTADGRGAGERIASAGYGWCQVGENLALHLDSRGFEARALAEKSVQGWINSPGHRENLLAPHMTEIGVGVVRAPGKDPKYISVQLFARPKSLEYEFQISNSSRESVSYTFGGETHEVKPSYAVTHTACSPGTLSFDKWGAGPSAKPLSMRYEASDGLVYVLKPDTAAGLRIDVAPLRKAK
jgi:hypothetical protein